MANITQQQFSQLLQNAPQGTDPKQLMDTLIQRGNNLEGYSPPPKPGLIGSIWDSTKKVVGDTLSAFGGGQNSVGSKIINDVQAGAADMTKGNQEFSQGHPWQGGADIIKGVVKSGARPALDAAQAVFTPIGSAIRELSNKTGFTKNVQEPVANYLGDKISNIKEVQDFAVKHPEAGEDFQRALFAVMLATGGGKADESSVLNKDVTDIPGDVKTEVKNVGDDIKGKSQEVLKSKQETEVNKLEQDYDRWTGATKSGAKRLYDISKKTAALDSTGLEVKTPQRVLAEAGVIPDTQGTKFNTAEQADIFAERAKPMEDANKAALKEVADQAPPADFDVMFGKIAERINSLKITMGDKESMLSDAKNEIDLLKKKYGNSVRVDDLNNEKQAYGKPVKWDKVNPAKPLMGDVNYQISRVFRETIEQVAKDAGNEEVAQLNRNIGDTLEASKFLKNLHGQTLKGGRLGKYVYTAIGSTLGHTLVGKVLGAVGGDMLGELLMRNDVANPLKRLILKSIKEQSPEAYDETVKWVKEQKGKQPETSDNADFSPKSKTGQSLGKAIDKTKDTPAGLSTKSVPLHPEDSKVLTQYIDHIRTKADVPEEDLLMAEKIFEKLGISQDKSTTALANEAEKILTGQTDASALYKTGRPFAKESPLQEGGKKIFKPKSYKK